MKAEQILRATGKTRPGRHVPVLAKEVIKTLAPSEGQIVADCTFGFAGHGKRFISCIGETGRYIAMDIDSKYLKKAHKRIAGFKTPASFHHTNFDNIAKIKDQEQVDGFDIIFADLGVSSMQVDDPSRGISYKNDGPLDMRMDQRLQKTGSCLLAELTEQELSEILLKYSDEPDHEIIARFITASRISRPVTKVNELVNIVLNAKGLTERTWKKQNRNSAFGSAHPASRTFQALRIAVNGELDSLEKLLNSVPKCLRPGGRVGIISFHSGEDRLVKKAFSDGYKAGIYQRTSLKPIIPAKWEIQKNPRSSSAKFR